MTTIDATVTRLKRIEGQVRGLQRMVAEARPYEETITQFMAIRAALDKVGITIVADHIQDCTRRQSAGLACIGDLERALALFLRMDWRVHPFDPDPFDPDPTDMNGESAPAPTPTPVNPPSPTRASRRRAAKLN